MDANSNIYFHLAWLTLALEEHLPKETYLNNNLDELCKHF